MTNNFQHHGSGRFFFVLPLIFLALVAQLLKRLWKILSRAFKKVRIVMVDFASESRGIGSEI